MPCHFCNTPLLGCDGTAMIIASVMPWGSNTAEVRGELGRCAMWRVVVLGLSLGMTACATKYQDAGFTGGVRAEQLTADTYRIVARGNGYTSGTTVQDYALLKAAETTQKAGGTHFLIGGNQTASSLQTVVTPGYAQTNIYGRTAVTTYSPGYVSAIVKPGADMYVRVVTVPTGKEPPPGAISAAEIVQFIGCRVQRPEGEKRPAECPKGP